MTEIGRGACGSIIDNGDGTVTKIIRGRRRRRSRDADQQVELHEEGRRYAADKRLIFVPNAWRINERAYKMEKIDTSRPIYVDGGRLDHPANDEIAQWTVEFWNRGKYACDFEMYEQPDGRVALVDFDKFADCSNGVVRYPWGLRQTIDSVAPFWPPRWYRGD